ncbi:MAG: class I SAM-dependent methyltransferase [Christensenellaceae bacterium]|jgi:ubiquinone/menaquinone biosynthesis C-methylase UbiE|nr:class I SAM-dependent methyltransferase [Christensenellaceae bacterium]
MNKDYIKNHIETYDKVANEYNERFNSLYHKQWTNDEWRRFFAKHITKDSNVLEVGSGSCRMLNIMSSITDKTSAVELSPQMAKYSKMNSPKSNIIVADIKKVSFADKVFDVIFTDAFIHCFPMQDINFVLSKFYEWLKDNGNLIVGTTLHDEHKEGFLDKENYIDAPKRFRTQFTAETFADTLKNNKFNIVEQYNHQSTAKHETGKLFTLTLAVCEKNLESI